MKSESSPDRSGQRHRRRLTNEVKEALRDLRIQLGVLNHQVGTRLELKDVDLDCLDLIARQGPLSPTALARRAGVHPATMTGILDRLERAGWIVRDRDASDRRAVVVRALHDRAGEVLGLYAGMNRALDRICAGYGVAELEVLADFLRRTTEAGQVAADKLTGD
jgi:DNA-binding MarR family transcriptional regulator